MGPNVDRNFPQPPVQSGDATIALYPSCLCAFIAEHRVGYFRAAGTYWGRGGIGSHQFLQIAQPFF